MSNEERDATVDALRATAKRAAASPEAARGYFVKLGLIDASGEFTEHYKNLGQAIRPPVKRVA